MMNHTNNLKAQAHSLRLSGLLSSLEVRLQEAESHRLPYAEFLELVFQDEINVRNQRLIARRNKSADFRELRSLENFDFGFNTSVNRAQIYQLATCAFVRERRDVLFVGPPGVGKRRGGDRGSDEGQASEEESAQDVTVELVEDVNVNQMAASSLHAHRDSPNRRFRRPAASLAICS